MIKKILFLLFFFGGSVARLHGQSNGIGILYSKISTLVFKEEIVDIEIGNQEYHVKVKGRYLLLRAKHKHAQPTSLFVRYGKKMHYYVADIFPDENASLQYHLELEEDIGGKEAEKEKKVTPTFSENNQEYSTLGVISNGIHVILTKILHTDNTTNLQLFIDNTSSIDLCLSHWTFEYVTVLRKFLFFKKKKGKLVEPITSPDSINVPAKSGKYVVFAIPIYVSEGGLEIFLGEDDGERGFRFSIPNEILLQAKRGKKNASHN